MSERMELKDLSVNEIYRSGKAIANLLPLEKIQNSIINLPKPEGHVRIVCISDTHDEHKRLKLPEADILIHAGDLTMCSNKRDLLDLETWFKSLTHIQHKIVIAGNHDILLHPEFYEKNWSRFHKKKGDPIAARAQFCNSPHFTYLEDSMTEVCGLNIYGSPWQPEFFNWAFNLDRSECIHKWRLIPSNSEVDILITHGPPIGIGDQCEHGSRVGCVSLLQEIEMRIKPRFHIFGHVHEGYGIWKSAQTTYVNASTCNARYKPFNRPIVMDIMTKENNDVNK